MTLSRSFTRRQAPVPHARGRPPAARRRRDVRRGAATRSGASASRRTSGTGFRSRCAACWWSIRTGSVLIDTALGNKETPSSSTSTASRTSGLEGATQLEDALATAGFLPEDVRWVINTHLHFDHAGGNTTMDPTLRDDPRRHVAADLSQCDLRGAAGRARVRPAHQRADPGELSPAQLRAGRGGGPWRLLEGDGEVLPGISVRLTPGHVPFHQAVLVQDRWRDRRVHGRSDSHHRAPAAAVDHGIRPGAAPDAGEQAGLAARRRGGRVASDLRARHRRWCRACRCAEGKGRGIARHRRGAGRRERPAAR